MSVQFIMPRGSILVIVAILAITIGASAAWAYLPAAVIDIYPATEERAVKQTVLLSKDTEEPDFVRFILPARFVEKSVEETQTYTRDAGEIHEDFAKGTVTLINNQDRPQPLLPQTHLKHEATGVYVLTDTSVTIPPQSEVKINVTAKEKGAKGDVAAGKFIIDKLPPHLQKLVYATSTQALNGGVATDNPLTQAEIDEAKNEVKEKAHIRALGELTAEAGGAAPSADLMNVDILSESVTASAGSHASSYTVTTKVAARGFLVDENDLLQLTLLSLRKSAGEDEEFLTYRPESFSMEIERADYKAGTAQISGSLSGTFARKVGPTALSNKNLAGLSANEVQEHFKQIGNVGSVDVSFSPFWVNTVPAREDSVEINIRSEEKSNESTPD